MMRQLAAFTLVLFIVSGCATYSHSIPDNYAGPRAQLQDSVKTHSGTKADFFVAEAIDGTTINNSLAETFRRNQGRGMSMTPHTLSRPIMAGKPIKVLVKGRTHYAAPILTMVRTVYQVTGVIEFVPVADARYVVRGELSENSSAVWIEDADTQKVVGNKVESSGSSKLGILEK